MLYQMPKDIKICFSFAYASITTTTFITVNMLIAVDTANTTRTINYPASNRVISDAIITTIF